MSEAHRLRMLSHQAAQVDLSRLGYPPWSPEEARKMAKTLNESPERWARGWERCLRERWAEHETALFPYRSGQVATAIQQHMEER